MMDTNKIKEKIRKLLNLSQDNPSDEESYSALQKAQQLMAEYKLSEKDVSDSESTDKCIQKKTRFSYGSRSSDGYRNDLAEIIAENFCCVNFISTIKGTSTHYIYFMGLEEDVDICEEAMNIADFSIIRGYNRVYKDLCNKYDVSYVPAKIFNKAKLGYIAGYLKGLKEALLAQKEQHQEWGLVLVTPPEAKEYIDSLDVFEYRQTRIIPTVEYYDEGYNDGTKFIMNKKLEGVNPTTKLE